MFLAVMIGKRIAELRIRRNISQRQLAKKIGTSSPTISRIESGETPNPGMDIITKIAGALGTTVEYLRSGKKTEIPPDFDDLSPELQEIAREFYSLTPDEQIEALKEFAKAFKYIKPEIFLTAIKEIKKSKEEGG